MKSLRTQLKKGVQGVSLSRDERELLREHLVAYMEYLPIRRSEIVPAPAFHIPFRFLLGRKHVLGALTVALLVTTTTAGVSSAAYEALPGDFLYPVKIHVNENVKSAFITSDEARLAWEKERARLRIEEASMLAREGRLDSALQEEVSRRFVAHTDAVVERMHALEKDDPALAVEVASELEDTLETQGAMLVRISMEQDSEINPDTREFVMQIHKATEEVAVLRTSVEDRIMNEGEVGETALLAVEGTPASNGVGDTSDLAVAEGADASTETLQTVAIQNEETAVSGEARKEMARRASVRAENQLARVSALLSSVSDEAEIALLQEQIARGEQRVALGDEALQNGTYHVAYNAYRDVATHFQKVADSYAVAGKFALAPYSGLALAELEADFPYGVGGAPENDVEIQAPVAESVTAVSEAPVDTQEEILRLRAEVREGVSNIRASLDTVVESNESSEYSKMRSAVHDLASDALRGEMYMDAGATDKGLPLLTHTKKRIAEVAHEIEQVKTPKPAEYVDAGDDGVQEPSEAPASTAVGVEDTAKTLVVWQTYNADTKMHTFVGTLSLPTCETATAEVRTSSVVPQTLTLQLKTVRDASLTCTESVYEYGYFASTSAYQNAVLKDVTIDGASVSWKLGEFSTNTFEVTEEERATESATSGTPETGDVLQRTLKSVQGLFR